MNVSLFLELLQTPHWTRYVIEAPEAHDGDPASSFKRKSFR